VRCQALALLAAGAAFSHLTAARLCDLPVPRGALGEPLEITTASTRPRIEGVRAHQGDVGADACDLGGLRVTSGLAPGPTSRRASGWTTCGAR